VDKPRIAYAPRANALAKTEIAVLANIYKFALDCHAKREATRPSSPDDPEKRSDEIRAKTRIP
jgi:hypothetical protein